MRKLMFSLNRSVNAVVDHIFGPRHGKEPTSGRLDQIEMAQDEPAADRRELARPFVRAQSRFLCADEGPQFVGMGFVGGLGPGAGAPGPRRRAI